MEGVLRHRCPSKSSASNASSAPCFLAESTEVPAHACVPLRRHATRPSARLVVAHSILAFKLLPLVLRLRRLELL